MQWLFGEAAQAERDYAIDYLGLRAEEGYGWGAVRGAWGLPFPPGYRPHAGPAGLGADARMNAPGTTGDQNWSWRVRSAALNSDVAGKLRHLTRVIPAGRLIK